MNNGFHKWLALADPYEVSVSNLMLIFLVDKIIWYHVIGWIRTEGREPGSSKDSFSVGS